MVVNTCGFIDSAKQESLDAIGEAISENGRVIVTGCMWARATTPAPSWNCTRRYWSVTGPAA